MHDEITIGARLRALRRWRGMSLAQLAGQADLSVSFLSMAERGLRSLDRRSHISALASALRVSEVDLVGGPHLSADREQAAGHAYVPALRVALQTNMLGYAIVDRARDLDELVSEMGSRIERLRRACDYAAIGERLPALLDELHLHAADPADEVAHRVALTTLLEACVAATFTAKNLGYPDLAHVAADRAREAAAILDDPVQRGKAAFLQAQTLPKNAQQRAATLTARAADALEPHADTGEGVAVLGMLTLTSSLAAATLYDGAGAQHWLDEAGALAGRLPDAPASNWMSFSPTNVAVWRVTVGVERGMGGQGVLELAEEVDEGKLGRSSANRHASFLADVGRGLARERKTRTEAVRWFRRAEQVAPQRIRNSAPTRDAVAVLLSQAHAEAGGRELRGMAARMGVPH